MEPRAHHLALNSGREARPQSLLEYVLRTKQRIIKQQESRVKSSGERERDQ
jgi:hypothetical protein